MLTEGLALPIDISVTATREVDALEATGSAGLSLHDLLRTHLGRATDEEGLPWV